MAQMKNIEAAIGENYLFSKKFPAHQMMLQLGFIQDLPINDIKMR
jgi:hypothetical protein